MAHIRAISRHTFVVFGLSIIVFLFFSMMPNSAHAETYTTPTGSLHSSGCTIQNADDTCSAIIVWETTQVPQGKKVKVFKNDIEFQCSTANAQHTKKTGKWIGDYNAKFTLEITDDCKRTTTGTQKLASITVRAEIDASGDNDPAPDDDPDPQEPQPPVKLTPSGTLLGKNCMLALGEPYCSSLITWESKNVPKNKKVKVFKDGIEFHCSTANTKQTKKTGKWIGQDGATFTLEIADTCKSASKGTQTLVSHTVRAVAPSLVCSYTGEPLRTVDHSFLSIIVNEVTHKKDYVTISDRLADANIHSVRRSIRWDKLQPYNKDSFAWEQYDVLFRQFKKDGLAVIVTLTGTPQWASSNPTAQNFHTYAPRDIHDWERFVQAVVERYGPHASDPTLRNIINYVDIWQEPNGSDTSSLTPEQYVTLLNAAYPIIKAEVPQARIWAGQLALANSNPKKYTPWVKTIVRDGLFDGFAIHTFHPTVREMVESPFGGFLEMQRLINQEAQKNGKGKIPVIVTAAQIWDSGYEAGNPAHCPYRDKTEEEHARILTDMYVCLANAGAELVSTFKATDRNLASWAPGVCSENNDIERNGILGLYNEIDPNDDRGFIRKASYWAVKAIGDMVAR